MALFAHRTLHSRPSSLALALALALALTRTLALALAAAVAAAVASTQQVQATDFLYTAHPSQSHRRNRRDDSTPLAPDSISLSPVLSFSLSLSHTQSRFLSPSHPFAPAWSPEPTGGTDLPMKQPHGETARGAATGEERVARFELSFFFFWILPKLPIYVAASLQLGDPPS